MVRLDCDFCKEFVGDSENSFHKIYARNPDSRVLLRSDEFAVIPSLGQILEGYLLVLPIKHFKALGDPSSLLLEEFAAVSECVGKILRDQYGPYILFEHGTRSEGVGGCGIYHAHLHVVPLAQVPDPVDALKSTFPYTKLAHPNEIGERSAGLPSYLFYQDSNARLYLFDTGPLPSQYMRKVLADALGGQDWNWRDAEREERLLATIRRLSGQFDSMQNFAHVPTHDAL
jgi:diadenosine tetraphosphate (Ap4A) HIT family hydrolase